MLTSILIASRLSLYKSNSAVITGNYLLIGYDEKQSEKICLWLCTRTRPKPACTTFETKTVRNRQLWTIKVLIRLAGCVSKSGISCSYEIQTSADFRMTTHSAAAAVDCNMKHKLTPTEVAAGLPPLLA